MKWFILLSFTAFAHCNDPDCLINQITAVKTPNSEVSAYSADTGFRVFMNFIGLLDGTSCIAYCGCNGFSNAIHDPCMELCWCENSLPSLSECGDTEKNCQRIYDASGGIKSLWENVPPAYVAVNEEFFVSSKADPNTHLHGFSINQKLQVSSSNEVSMVVGMPGNYTIIYEANAFYGCASEPKYMIVTPNETTTFEFDAPKEMLATPNFMFITAFYGPSDYKSLEFVVNGETNAMFANPAGSMFAEIGGNYETKRGPGTYERTFINASQAPVVLNFNHELPEDGLVTGFSAHITKTGTLRFLILQPFCSSGLLCSLTKSCKQESGCSRSPHMFIIPDDKVFLVKYMQFADDKTLVPDPRVTEFSLSFTVVYHFDVNATYKGHQVFPIPVSEQFKAGAGQILAWMPISDNPGDVAYNKIESPDIKWEAIHLLGLNDLIAGSLIQNDFPMFQIKNTEHMVSVFMEFPATYKISLPGDFPDGTELHVELMMTDSKDKKLKHAEFFTTILHKISNFHVNLTAVPQPQPIETVPRFMTGDEIGFTASATSGLSKSKICINKGDSGGDATRCDELISAQDSIKLRFASAGIFTISFKAYTTFSQAETTFTIEIVCPINSPVFFPDGYNANYTVLPVSTKSKYLLAYLSLSGCGMITMSLSLKSPLKSVSMDVEVGVITAVVLALRFIEFQDAKQTVNITVTAKNQLFTKTANTLTHVQEPIEDCDLELKTAETGWPHIVKIAQFKGTNQSYCVRVENQTDKVCTTTSNQDLLEFTFDVAGNFSLSLSTWNFISDCQKSRIQEVQDRISKCSIRSYPTIFGEYTFVKFHFLNGTGVTVHINYLNTQGSKVAEAMDIDAKGDTVVYGFSRYKYTVKNDGKVCLVLKNDISEEDCCVVVIVEDALTEVTIVLIQAEEGNKKLDFIEENENLTFKAVHNADAKRNLYIFDFGDGFVVQSSSNVVNHSFKNWNVDDCYNVTVNATNPVSSKICAKTFCVQRPVDDVVVDKIVHAPEKSTEKMEITVYFQSGNVFECTFNFSDGSELDLTTFDNNDAPSVISVKVHHKFAVGLYNVYVSCWNRLFEMNSVVIVTSQLPISFDDIQIYSDCKNETSNALIPGVGNDEDIFTAACNFTIFVDNLLGTNVTLTVELRVSTFEPRIERVYNNNTVFLHHADEPLPRYETVLKVHASNLVSNITFEKKIILLAPVSDAVLKIKSSQLKIGKKIHFDFTMTGEPGDVCLGIDFKDGYKYVYGESCEKSAYQKHIWVQTTFGADAPFKVTHKYQESAIYLLEYELRNDVSVIKKSLLLKIIEFPCLPPTLKFDSCLVDSPEDAKANANFFKCRNTTLKYIVHVDCQRPNATFRVIMKHEWLNDYTNKFEMASDELEVDSKIDLLSENLKYGLHKLIYCTQMVDTLSKEYIDGTEGFKEAFFYIKPCDLEIGFVGGNEQAFEKKGIVHVDASASRDPDNAVADLQVTWYCTRKNTSNLLTMPRGQLKDIPSIIYPDIEQFTANDFSNPSYEGCFAKERHKNGKLSDKGHNSVIIKLDTQFMTFGCYDLLLQLQVKNDVYKRVSYEGYELCLTNGPPAKVAISCKLNCNKKKNSGEKLGFESHFENKQLCKNTPTYTWSLFGGKENSTEGFIDITDEIKNFTTTELSGNTTKSHNFGLKANSLSPEISYRLKLKIICDGIQPGMAAIYFHINIAPDISNASCKIDAMEGIAMTTDHIISCEGVVDVDLPITYSFWYICNGDKEVPITASTSVYPPVSSPFKLPVGNASDGFKCNFKVYASDVYKMYSKPISDNLYVVVKPNSDARKRRSVESPTRMCVELMSPVVLNSQATRTNYMTVINEMLDSLPRESRAFCEEELSKALVDLVIDGPEASVSVLNNVRTNGNPNAGLHAIGNVVASMGELNADQLGDLTDNILSKTSQLSMGDGDEMGDVVASAMALEAMMTAAVAVNLMVGEPPSISHTPDGEIQMQRLDMSSSAPIGSFSLGSVGAEGCGAVNSVGRNRYGFHSQSSASIKGKVQGMTLTNPDGSTRVVKNLSEPIIMVIENEEVFPPMKNFSAYQELMRDVHRVLVTVNTSIIILTAKPVHDNFTGHFYLFMNKGRAPSLVDSQQNCTLPRHQPDVWWNMTEDEKDMWLDEKKWSCFISEKDLNGTAIGDWCVAVVYYSNESRLATELLTESEVLATSNHTSSVPYFFSAYNRACLYWISAAEGWGGDGCKVVEKDTNKRQTTCACNHLTDFGGGGPFATAEPLDLGAIFSMDLEDNPTVFAVVMALFALYFILLLWARKKDKSDIEKTKLIALPENHPADKYFYEINVQTGFKSGCSTTAEVAIVLNGSVEESAPRRLYSPDRRCFQRGETDWFLFSVPKCLGELEEIDIWHNNKGESPGWYCLQIQIRDLQTEQRWDFVCNKWLDVAEDDGMIMRKLKAANNEDLTEFSFLFSVTTRRNLYDGHIWLSVFTRPAQSSFTRCQRLATCTSLLFTSLIFNAMFYRGNTGVPSTTIKLGLFTFSVDEVKIAFTVAIMVIPCNLLIILLFKKAGPKERKERYEMENNVNVTISPDDETTKESKREQLIRFTRSIFFAGAEDEADERLSKRRNPLPYWLIYVAYTLAFLTTIVSAFFVVMYGFSFGKVKADQWIVSMLFSFCWSVFLFQPLKVLVLSILFALLVRKPASNTGGPIRDFLLGKSEEEEEEEERQMVLTLNQKLTSFKLPDERRLQEARIARMKEKRIKIIIKEVVVHLSFVVLIIVVSYAAVDPSAYALHDSVLKLCAENGVSRAYWGGVAYVRQDKGREVQAAAEVTHREEWWDWAVYSVVDFLFPDGWYDGKRSTYPTSFVADSASSKVLAMARFRQLRVERNSCTKHPVFEHLIVECNAGYTWSSEETRQFRTGWQPPYNVSERFRRRRGKRKAMWKGLEDPWLHQNTTLLKNPFPFTGRFATYNGASYSVSIGPNKRVAKRIIKEMKKNFWVDRYTRALFTEVNIYNANTNLMLIATFLHEILPTGSWKFYSNVQALRLYRYMGGLGDLILLFDILFAAITFIGLYKAIRSARRKGVKKYMMSLWNCFHVVVTGCSLCAIAFTIGRMMAVRQAVKAYSSDPELFVSFQYVGALEYLIVGSLGFVLFFTNLEFLRILRFNHLIAMLSKTISILGTPLASFGMIFLVLFMAYVSFAHCIYVDKLEAFQTVISTFVSLTQMFLGKFDVHAFFDNAPFFGPLMFGTYMLSIQMIMINLFVGLICDAFAEVGEEEGPDEEPSVFNFLANRMKRFGGTHISDSECLYTDWKDDWEQMMSDFEDRCDNCIYMMRNMEGEELRLNKYFDPNMADERKKNILAAVIGMNFFFFESELCDAILILEKRLKEMNMADTEEFLLAAAKKRKARNIVDVER